VSHFAENFGTYYFISFPSRCNLTESGRDNTKGMPNKSVHLKQYYPGE